MWHGSWKLIDKDEHWQKGKTFTSCKCEKVGEKGLLSIYICSGKLICFR